MSHDYDEDGKCLKCGIGAFRAIINDVDCVAVQVVDHCTCEGQYFTRDNQWCAYCIRTGQDKAVARKIADMNARSLSRLPPWPNTSQQPKPVEDKPRQQLTDAQQAQGEGVARAVDNLNSHEHRLGSSRWQP